MNFLGTLITATMEKVNIRLYHYIFDNKKLYIYHGRINTLMRHSGLPQSLTAGYAMRVDDKEIIVTGRRIKTARIDLEWDDDIEDPASFI